MTYAIIDSKKNIIFQLFSADHQKIYKIIKLNDVNSRESLSNKISYFE